MSRTNCVPYHPSQTNSDQTVDLTSSCHHNGRQWQRRAAQHSTPILNDYREDSAISVQKEKKVIDRRITYYAPIDEVSRQHFESTPSKSRGSIGILMGEVMPASREPDCASPGSQVEQFLLGPDEEFIDCEGDVSSEIRMSLFCNNRNLRFADTTLADTTMSTMEDEPSSTWSICVPVPAILESKIELSGASCPFFNHVEVREQTHQNILCDRTDHSDAKIQETWRRIFASVETSAEGGPTECERPAFDATYVALNMHSDQLHCPSETTKRIERHQVTRRRCN